MHLHLSNMSGSLTLTDMVTDNFKMTTFTHYLPPPRIEQFKRLPLYSLPMEWNKAGDITLQENKVTFRYAVKDRLFLELSEDQLI